MSRGPEGGATRERGYWDTMSLEVKWSRARKTVSHERADLILDALANGKPVEGVTDKKGDMGELSDAPYEAGRSIKDRLELRHISRGKTNVDSIAIVYPGADKSVDQNRNGMQRE